MLLCLTMFAMLIKWTIEEHAAGYDWLGRKGASSFFGRRTASDGTRGASGGVAPGDRPGDRPSGAAGSPDSSGSPGSPGSMERTKA